MKKFHKQDLIKCARGELFDVSSLKLPLPPMLMLDSVDILSSDQGDFGHGHAEGAFAVTSDSWFFDCHFYQDGVMPGCLMLDGLWQLTGFFLSHSGSTGLGRALGVGNVAFYNPVTENTGPIVYSIQVKKIIKTKKKDLIVTDGFVHAGPIKLTHATDIKVCAIREGEQ